MIGSIVSLFIIAGVVLTIVSYLIWRFTILEKYVIKYIIWVFIVFFLSFYGVFLLPLDVSSTFYETCTYRAQKEPSLNLVCIKPKNFVDSETLVTIWRTIYWSLFIMSQIILPFSKAFSVSGHFSIFQKFKYALKYNLAFFCLYIVLFIILLLYMRFRPEHTTINFVSIRATLAATANTAGIFLLIIIMGYGLVDVPRHIWQSSNNQMEMDKMFFEISKAYDNIVFYQEKLENNIKQIVVARRQVQIGTECYGYIQTIMSKLSEEDRLKILNNEIQIDSNIESAIPYTIIDHIKDIFGFTTGIEELDYNKTETLANIHTKVISHLNSIKSSKAYLNYLIYKARYYEFILSIANDDRNAAYPYRPYLYSLFPGVLRFWYKNLRSLFIKLWGISCGVLSFIIVFSEITMSITKIQISILAVIIHKLYESSVNFLIPQIFAFVFLSYMTFCTYRTAFFLKLFDQLKIISNHQTQVYSMLTAATFVGFFFPSICINFLSMIHFDIGTMLNLDHPIETSFSHIEGRFELLPFISAYFNIYYPLIIILVCFVSFEKFVPRFLQKFGFQLFSSHSSYSQEIISEGRSIYNRRKRKVTPNVNQDGEALILSDTDFNTFSKYSLPGSDVSLTPI